MKKIISILLSLVAIFTLTIPTLAVQTDYQQNATIAFSNNGHGQFAITSETPPNTNSIIGKSEETIVATKTKNDEIYHYKENQYLVQASESTYLLTNKIDINVDNFTVNEATLNFYSVSANMREDMVAVIEAQKAIGNDELEISIYAPSFDYSNAVLLANEPVGTSYYTYNHNGYTYYMKNHTIEYRNLSTGMKAKNGTSALSTAKAWGNFIVSAVGTVSDAVAGFGIFSSAYELFKAYRGEALVGSSDDQLYTNLIYDRLMKETSVRDIDGEYIIGNCSYKAWLNRHDCYQFYSDNGESYFDELSLNSVHFSENFENPNLSAVQHYGGSFYIDGFLYTELLGHTVLLMGT